jgi:hypothetical protein
LTNSGSGAKEDSQGEEEGEDVGEKNIQSIEMIEKILSEVDDEDNGKQINSPSDLDFSCPHSKTNSVCGSGDNNIC